MKSLLTKSYTLQYEVLMYKENTLHIWYYFRIRINIKYICTGQWTLHRSIYRWALNRSYNEIIQRYVSCPGPMT